MREAGMGKSFMHREQRGASAILQLERHNVEIPEWIVLWPSDGRQSEVRARKLTTANSPAPSTVVKDRIVRFGAYSLQKGP